MKLEDVTVGQWVVYAPRPGVETGEDGEVVEVRDGGYVMVRYRNGLQAGKVCATRAADLQPGAPE